MKEQFNSLVDVLLDGGFFLEEAVEKAFVLYFEHDPVNECCTVQQTEKGVRVKEIFRLKDL